MNNLDMMFIISEAHFILMCIFVHNIPLVIMLFYHRTLIVLVLKDAYIYNNLSGKEGRLEHLSIF